jgi:hypothetical protein
LRIATLSVEISFVTTQGLLEISDRTLIVGLDETGCEDFKDPRNPVFGLGGCAILVKDYYNYLDYPWKEIKHDYFDGADVPLHAADLSNPNGEQLLALEDFFTTLPFFRFACMASINFNDKNSTNESVIYLVALSIINQICSYATLMQPESIIYVIDQNHRMGKELRLYLETYSYGNGVTEFKAQVLTASKDVSATCVEVADFIVHPAGARVRNRMLGKFNFRKDFELVFDRVDRKLSDYKEILSANSSSA